MPNYRHVERDVYRNRHSLYMFSVVQEIRLPEADPHWAAMHAGLDPASRLMAQYIEYWAINYKRGAVCTIAVVNGAKNQKMHH